MKVTVLGKSNAWPDTGGACSGYLVEEGDFRLLLDCGSGVFGKLRSTCGYADVHAVLISHLHSDHFIDLIPYSFALKYSTVRHDARPRLHVPPGGRDLFAGLGEVLGFGDQLERTFAISEYDGIGELEIGPFHVRFCEVPHYVQTFACELSTGSGARFTYGADCRYNQQLVEFANDTDLLLVEATEGTDAPPQPADHAGHMTALQAGELARSARAKRVVLSHFSDELDAATVLSAGSEGFGAEARLACEGASFTV